LIGRGQCESGPRTKSIEWGRASKGIWALFLEGGLGWSCRRGNRLSAFPPERIQGSGVWQCKDVVCTESGRWGVAGFISGGEHSTLKHAKWLLYARRRSSGVRQTSTAKMSEGVE